MLDAEGRLEAEIAELRADRDASVAREQRFRTLLKRCLAELDRRDGPIELAGGLRAQLRAALAE